MKKYVYLIAMAVLTIQFASCSKSDDESVSPYSRRDVSSRSYSGNSSHLLGGQIPGGTNTLPDEGPMFYIEFIDDSAYVSPTELTFPVEGGTQTVTIKVPGYKYFDFSINDEDKSWLSAKTVKGGYLEITAEPNDTGEERVGSVHCFIYNEENPTEEQKEYLISIGVTQEADEEEEGDYELVSGKVEMYYAHAWKQVSTFKAGDENVTITPRKKGAKVKILAEGTDYKYSIYFEIDDLSLNDSVMAQISGFKYKFERDVVPYSFYGKHVDWGEERTRMEAPGPQLPSQKGYWRFEKNDLVYYYKSTLHYDIWFEDIYSPVVEKTIETETTEVTDGSWLTINLDIKKRK